MVYHSFVVAASIKNGRTNYCTVIVLYLYFMMFITFQMKFLLKEKYWKLCLKNLKIQETKWPFFKGFLYRYKLLPWVA